MKKEVETPASVPHGGPYVIGRDPDLFRPSVLSNGLSDGVPAGGGGRLRHRAVACRPYCLRCSVPLEPMSQLFTRVLLARHGEVHDRWRRSIYGRWDVELSDVGQEQSQRLGVELAGVHLDAVVSSGLQRAEAAAAEVRANRPAGPLPRIDDPRFLELDRGDWAGKTVDELERDDPDAYALWIAERGAVRAPGGESPAEVAERVVPALDHWAAQHPGGAVLVVAHLWVVRSAVAAALGLPMARSGSLALPPGGICSFQWPVQDGSEGAVWRPPLLSGFGLAEA